MMGVKDAKNIFEQTQEQEQKPVKNSPPKRKVQSVFVPTQQASEDTTDSVPTSPSKRSMVTSSENSSTSSSPPKVIGKLNAKAMVNIPVNPFKPPVKFKTSEPSVTQDDSQIQKEGAPLKSLVKDRPKQMNKRATVHGTVSKRGQESIIFWSKDLLSDTEILVVDLQFSWEDGKALCYLLEKLYPGSIQLSSVSSKSVEDRFSLCVKVLNDKMVDPLDTRELYEEGAVVKSKLITVLSKLKFNSVLKQDNMEDIMEAHKLDVQTDVEMKKEEEESSTEPLQQDQEAKKDKKKAKKGTKKDQQKVVEKVEKVKKERKEEEIIEEEVKKEEIKEAVKETKKESRKEKKEAASKEPEVQKEVKQETTQKEQSKEEELKEKIQKELEQEELGHEQLKEKIQKELEKEETEEKEEEEEEEPKQKEVQKDVSMPSVSSTSTSTSTSNPSGSISWFTEIWSCFMSLFNSNSVASKAF